MYDNIENKIQEEAVRRATLKMADYNPPLALLAQQYGLAPETQLQIDLFRSMSISFTEFDEHLKPALFKTLTDHIAQHLRESLQAQALKNIDLASL
jgi:hypothetical protein